METEVTPSMIASETIAETRTPRWQRRDDVVWTMKRRALATTTIVLSLLVATGQATRADHETADACPKVHCWVDVFSEKRLGTEGDHDRICGPVTLRSLENVNGSNWSNAIQSLVVGRGVVWLEIYDGPDRRRLVKLLLAGEQMRVTGGSIDSLDLGCK